MTVPDSPFQVMPPLTADELVALEADIVARGVLVAVVIDQHGRTLDGHHRRAICDRLGIGFPLEVREVVDDDDARQIALSLNLARRHLSREQRRELVLRECQARPSDSDRQIARRLGCSPSTVAAVRRPVSKLDTSELTREEAETLEAAIRCGLDKLDDALVLLPPVAAVKVMRLIWADMEERYRGDEDFLGPVRRHMILPRLDALLAAVA